MKEIQMRRRRRLDKDVMVQTVTVNKAKSIFNLISQHTHTHTCCLTRSLTLHQPSSRGHKGPSVDFPHCTPRGLFSIQPSASLENCKGKTKRHCSWCCMVQREVNTMVCFTSTSKKSVAVVLQCCRVRLLVYAAHFNKKYIKQQCYRKK